MKTLLIFIGLCCLGQGLMAQSPNTIVCTYDNSGNRILRKAIYITPSNRFGQEEATNTSLQPLTSLYPNPSVENITLAISPECAVGGSSLQVEIYDIQGKQVLNMPLQVGTNVLPIATFPVGTYIALVRDANRVIANHKWIKS